MKKIKVCFENKDCIITRINGTKKDIRKKRKN